MAQVKEVNYLQNIRSLDIKKIVLEFLNEKKRLNIIIYNKSFRK